MATAISVASSTFRDATFLGCLPFGSVWRAVLHSNLNGPNGPVYAPGSEVGAELPGSAAAVIAWPAAAKAAPAARINRVPIQFP
jgi:hypothetical protein